MSRAYSFEPMSAQLLGDSGFWILEIAATIISGYWMTQKPHLLAFLHFVKAPLTD